MKSTVEFSDSAVDFYGFAAEYCRSAAKSGGCPKETLQGCLLSEKALGNAEPFGEILQNDAAVGKITVQERTHFATESRSCAGLSYTFPVILHAILHPRLLIITGVSLWWCRMYGRIWLFLWRCRDFTWILPTMHLLLPSILPRR